MPLVHKVAITQMLAGDGWVQWDLSSHSFTQQIYIGELPCSRHLRAIS